MLHAKCFSYFVFSHYLSLFLCVCYLPVVHRSSAVLSGSGQQDDYRNVADRPVLPLLSLEDDWPSYRHLSHFPDHAWWVKTAASDNVESSQKSLLLPQFFVCYFLDHEHTDLDPAVLATLKKLQDGYFGGARSDNEAINKCNVINNTVSATCLLLSILLGSKPASYLSSWPHLVALIWASSIVVRHAPIGAGMKMMMLRTATLEVLCMTWASMMVRGNNILMKRFSFTMTSEMVKYSCW